MHLNGIQDSPLQIKHPLYISHVLFCLSTTQQDARRVVFNESIIPLLLSAISVCTVISAKVTLTHWYAKYLFITFPKSPRERDTKKKIPPFFVPQTGFTHAFYILHNGPTTPTQLRHPREKPLWGGR